MQNFNGDFEELARLMDSSSLLAEKNLSVFIFNVNRKWRFSAQAQHGASVFERFAAEVSSGL